jgi:hypothetical protein
MREGWWRDLWFMQRMRNPGWWLALWIALVFWLLRALFRW